MNKVYKVIWSKVRGSYVVVSEIVKKRGGGSKLGRMKSAVVGMTVAALLVAGSADCRESGHADPYGRHDA